MERFCGIWEEGAQEFQVRLAKCSLEHLALDVTRVKIDMEINNVNSDFFVVHVEFLTNAKRYSFKVSVDISSVTLVRDGDLEGLTCGEDYLRVHVILKKLEELTLCVDQYKDTNEYLEELPSCSENIIIKTTLQLKINTFIFMFIF